MTDLNLEAIEALCKAAHVEMLDGMFVTQENDYQAGVWFPDGDMCAIVEDNMGANYLYPVSLARLFAAAPTAIPALLAALRAERARAGELERENAKAHESVRRKVVELRGLDDTLNDAGETIAELEAENAGLQRALDAAVAELKENR